MSAAEAADWGLVTRVVQPDHGARRGARRARRRAAGRRRRPGSTSRPAVDAEYGLYDRVGMTASLVGDEPLEGFESFKERRSPSWVRPRSARDGEWPPR
ncbi:MAG: hypothetical protein U5K30_17410 [Acidimicrobiales bacterium]|nr:hypothetical protein [Acidimicrobiales bacterium]